MRSIILAIGLLFSAAGLAQDSADGREVKSYKLTDAGFAKYLQATRNIRALPIGNCG